jgi:hypothetical protein
VFDPFTPVELVLGAPAPPAPIVTVYAVAGETKLLIAVKKPPAPPPPPPLIPPPPPAATIK